MELLEHLLSTIHYGLDLLSLSCHTDWIDGSNLLGDICLQLHEAHDADWVI